MRDAGERIHKGWRNIYKSAYLPAIQRRELIDHSNTLIIQCSLERTKELPRQPARLAQLSSAQAQSLRATKRSIGSVLFGSKYEFVSASPF